ncbi:hypothetical protein HN832_01270 [archaeon]|jgi:hypothetical protein|nr:hypothetical protein [archaeon]MBT4373902.1 hypothetical protein [archaeon]MBT4532179.1 hypothetical protein [archaeon]MBT7001132.1 hypothetical protein [archaeon]MBT7282021.1 hypothetical protein [archaeon]
MELLNLLQLIAVPISLLGNFLVARKNFIGFFVWIFSNCLWIIISVFSGLWGMTFLFFVYSMLNIYAIYFWTKN